MDKLTEPTADKGIWVIALVPGGERGYIGCVQHASERKFTDALTTEDCLASHTLTLNPCYNYRALLARVPVGQAANGQPIMGLSQEPLVSSFEFTIHPTPVYIPGPLQGTTVCFFSDLNAHDRRTYETFVENAVKQATAQRAAASGLVLGNVRPGH